MLQGFAFRRPLLPLEVWLSLQEVADRLRCTGAEVVELIAGPLSASHIDGELRVHSKALESYRVGVGR